MKRLLILILLCCFSLFGNSQTVIVDKEIKIGQSANPSEAGAIRFTGTDFEGFDGSEWRSFTNPNSASSSIWGQPIINSLEDDKLNASSPGSSDFFGYSVSVSGNTAVIGAYLDDDAGVDAGCAYVFEKVAGIWTEKAKLTASDAVNNHWLGFSASIANDVIVVGCYRDNGDTGAAYVYEKPIAGWTNMTETAKLTASDGAASDKFGLSVAISGDDIVAGSSEDDDNGVNSGSAYVYEKPMAGWMNMTETAKLTSSDANGSDLFGYSVSISENTIVIGAYLQDENGTDSGAAYVFEKPGATWASNTEDAKLTASDGAAGDWLGYSVDVNGDDIIVGAYGENGQSGSAYVFQKPSGDWVNSTESAKLDAENNTGTDRLGYSVAIDNGIAVVGAPYSDSPNLDQGSVILYQKVDGTWNHRLGTLSLKTSDGITDDRSGWSVAISGNTVLSGAFSSSGFDFGTVYVYTRK